MEQSVFSDQATAITGVDVTTTFEATQDSVVHLLLGQNDSKFASKFRNTAAPFHPRQTMAIANSQANDGKLCERSDSLRPSGDESQQLASPSCD